MCGIAGIAALSPVNRDAVQAMTDLMVHRGPDGEGQWLSADGRVCFGHRRLAIIDLTDRAAQPMQDAQGSLSITYNGEIYNYKEIRAELAEAGSGSIPIAIRRSFLNPIVNGGTPASTGSMGCSHSRCTTRRQKGSCAHATGSAKSPSCFLTAEISSLSRPNTRRWPPSMAYERIFTPPCWHNSW